MFNLLEIFRFITHYGLHFLFPGLVAWVFFNKKWKMSWLLMISTIIIDLDHLLASPIFDSSRCSIGFHPLHSHVAIFFYLFMFLIPNFYVRVIAVGLILHILTDLLDCAWLLF